MICCKFTKWNVLLHDVGCVFHYYPLSCYHNASPVGYIVHIVEALRSSLGLGLSVPFGSLSDCAPLACLHLAICEMPTRVPALHENPKLCQYAVVTRGDESDGNKTHARDHVLILSFQFKLLV